MINTSRLAFLLVLSLIFSVDAVGAAAPALIYQVPPPVGDSAATQRDSLLSQCLYGFTSLLRQSPIGDFLRSQRDRIRASVLSRSGDAKLDQQLERLLQSPMREKEENEIVDVLVSEYRKHRKIVVSVTTTPQRIDRMGKWLEHLPWKQLDEVVLTVPLTSRRSGEGYSLPKVWTSGAAFEGKLRVLRPEVDLGPISKLLPAAEYYQSQNEKALIITLDDDIFYAPGFVKEFVRLAATNDGNVFGASGPSLKFYGISTPKFAGYRKDLHITYPSSDVEILQAEILEGYAGIGYPSEVIAVADLKKLSQLSDEAIVSDDLVISMALQAAGVPLLRFRSNYYSRGAPHRISADYGYGPDALQNGAGFSSEDSGPIPMNNLKYQRTMKLLLNALGTGPE